MPNYEYTKKIVSEKAVPPRLVVAKSFTSKLLLAFVFQLSLMNSFCFAQDNTLSAKEKTEGWQLLFDGKSMSQWKRPTSDSFPTKGWSIEEGVLSIDQNNGRQTGGDIITKEQFSDFDFTVDFKLTEGANSGVKYSVHIYRPGIGSLGSVLGPEYQLLDDEKHPDAKAGRNGNRKLGSLYDMLPSSNTAKALKPIGEWNTARIIAKGKHVEHWLNGTKVLEYDNDSPAYQEAFGLSKFKPIPDYGKRENGHLMLQDHGNKVFFKNIKIRKL